MLGQPVSMLIPQVVGFRLTGELPEGSTATDLVLTITEMLRKHGVVGKFVEFYGDGVAAVPLANRATIGNMCPEFGSTLRHLPDRRRDPALPAGSPAARRSRSPWSRPTPRSRASGTTRPRSRGYSEELQLDLSTVVPSLAGPKRPQDRVALTDAKTSFREALGSYVQLAKPGRRHRRHLPGLRPGRRASTAAARPATAGRTAAAAAGCDRGHAGRRHHDLGDHGSVVIAAITSCTNTSNPSVMVGAAPAGQEGRREGPGAQAVGEDHAGARLEGGHGLLRARRPDAVPGEARLQPGRLRLHHLHRQLRPAAARRSAPRSPRTTSPWSRCCPATATSRAGSTPTSG